jgi:hypothetical protein
VLRGLCKLSEQCEFCRRQFDGKRVRKMVRGDPHVFCSESCFVMWRYGRPVPHWDAMYEKYTISVSADIEKLIEMGTGGDDHGSG